MTAWAKMSSNLDSNPKIRKAGRNGREVFLFVIRRNAELDMAGRIPEAHVEAWYLADQLMMPEQDAVSGLSACVRTGLLRIEDGHAVIVGWNDDWGKRPMTEGERKRIERAVKAAKAPSVDDHSIEKSVSGHVQKASDFIVTSPDCHGSEEIRSEEKRSEEREKSAAAPLAPPPRKSKRKSKPDFTEAEQLSAHFVLHKLSERSGVTYSGSVDHLRKVIGRFREGITEADMRKVIGYCAIELGWQDDAKMLAYLRPETLFGAESIHRYLDPARTWFEKNKLVLDDGERPRLELVP